MGQYQPGVIPFESMEELLHWCGCRYPVAYTRGQPDGKARIVSSAFLMCMSLDVVYCMVRKRQVFRAWPRERDRRQLQGDEAVHRYQAALASRVPT
jgi:hypothetical protein